MTAEAGPTDGARDDGLRIRQAVRAVVFTRDASVLLCRFEFDDRTVWALPGGGLEPGESHVDGLRRELDEEVGLTDVEIGPAVWSRRHLWDFSAWDGQEELVHLVTVARRFTPAPRLSWDELRAERLHELRWWTIAELRAATAAGTDFAPRRLAELVERLHVEGAPAGVIDTGV